MNISSKRHKQREREKERERGNPRAGRPWPEHGYRRNSDAKGLFDALLFVLRKIRAFAQQVPTEVGLVLSVRRETPIVERQGAPLTEARRA